MYNQSWVKLVTVAVLAAAAGGGGMYWALRSANPIASHFLGVSGRLQAAPRTLDLTRLTPLLSLLAPAERKRILGTAESFQAFVTEEAHNQSILGAAYAQAADQDPTAKLLMERAAHRVLIESYLNGVTRAKMDPGYPTETDVRGYYDKNPDQFRIPERIHVWQIFLPATSSTERRNAAALGRQLLESLLSGRADFASVALTNSKHEQSRLNGGYLGLLALRDMKGEIRDALAAAEEGKPIGPIETPEGFHLLKRGAAVPGTTLDFAQAKAQIIDLLRRQAAAAARAAAIEERVASYPVPVPAGLDQVRHSLRQTLLPDAVPKTTTH